MKMKLKLKIIFIPVMIVLCWGLFMAAKNTKRTETELVEVLSVYYSPDSFGGYEHWSGNAVKNNGDKVTYEILRPVEIGEKININ